jgi:hypothetical protein
MTLQEKPKKEGGGGGGGGGAYEIRLDYQLFESKLEDWKGKVRKMLALAP